MEPVTPPAIANGCDLEVVVSCRSDETVVELRGDVESAHEAQVTQLVEAALANHRRRVVLDLRCVDFFGAAGQNVIASVIDSRCGRTELVVRGASPAVRSTCMFNGTAAKVRFEESSAPTVAERESDDYALRGIGAMVLEHDVALSRPAHDPTADDAQQALRGAFATSSAIFQAQGVLMAHSRCSASSAALLMQREASGIGVELGEYAQRILATVQRSSGLHD